MQWYQIILMIAAVIGSIGYGIYASLKANRFLKNNPNKALISYSGGETVAGVYVHRVLSQSLDGEYVKKYFNTGGRFTVNAGKIELEVERITSSTILNKTTYTHHGKVNKTFTVEAGKKYKLKFDKKSNDFVL